MTTCGKYDYVRSGCGPSCREGSEAIEHRDKIAESRQFDGAFVPCKSLEEPPEFAVVVKCVAVERIERDRRGECGSLVPVDERIVGDEQSEELREAEIDVDRNVSSDPEPDVF